MQKHPLTSSRPRWLIGLCAVFLSVELGMRAMGYRAEPPAEPPRQYDPAQDPIPRAGDGLHENSTREIWTPVPGAEIPWSPGERVNREGYRGVALAHQKPADILRVAVLGDGTTFGEGVTWAQTYSAQLAQRLGERGSPSEVLDAGVIGFSVEQSFERYLELVRGHTPEIVILSPSCIEEQTPSPYLTDRMRIGRSMRQASGWSFVPKSPVWELRTLGWLHERIRSATPAAATPIFAPDEIEEALERRRLRKILHAAGSESPEWPGMRRVSFADFEKCVTSFVRLVREDQARPILVCLPRAPEIDARWSVLEGYRKILREIGEREQVQVVDPGARFARQLADKTQPTRIFDGARLEPAGHALLAQELAQAILDPAAR